MVGVVVLTGGLHRAEQARTVVSIVACVGVGKDEGWCVDGTAPLF